MGHVVHDKARLLARERRLRGQVESVERALDAGAGCADVMVGAMRRMGSALAYSSVAGLPAYSTPVIKTI